MPSSAFPPGPQGSFPFGVAQELSRDRLGFMTSCREQYGDLAHFQIFGRHAYLINDPTLVRFVLVEHPEYFYKTPKFKKATRSVIGQGLLTSEDELHKRQRRLVQPAFHHQRITAYGEAMVEQTICMLDTWTPGTSLDMHHEMMQLTMKIVARTMFSSDVSGEAEALGAAITDGLHDVMKRVTAPISLPEWMPTSANRRAKRQREALLSTIDRFIQQRRASAEDRGDLLSMLLLSEDGDGQRMSDQQVRDEAMTIFIAGHETTANALTWTAYLLAGHPEVQQKLQAELYALHGRPPGVGDLPLLPYTEMIIKETMRLYPPAWIVPRISIADFSMAGYRIPKNSLVFSCPYTMHRHPRFYEQPIAFMPERWTPDFERLLPKYAYFPFGGGPRVCIGNGFAMMEACLVLANIFQRFSLNSSASAFVDMEPVITLRPRGGLELQIDECQHAFTVNG